MHLTAAQDAKETWLVDDEVGCVAEKGQKQALLRSWLKSPGRIWLIRICFYKLPYYALCNVAEITLSKGTFKLGKQTRSLWVMIQGSRGLWNLHPQGYSQLS